MSWKLLEERAYIPYSAKPEVCMAESKTGKLYAGVRVENIAYPLSIPAVQAACCICLGEGEIPAKIYFKNEDLEQLDFWVKEFSLETIQVESPPANEFETGFHKQDIEAASLPKLQELLTKSVVPQSDFPVAALLYVDDGYFEGVNVEVSDWTKGLCAERVAIAKAIAAGYKEFHHLEVHTKKGEVSSPCGACRQVILEHLPYHKIMLHHADGTLSEHLTVDLLPFSFKSTTLKS